MDNPLYNFMGVFSRPFVFDVDTSFNLLVFNNHFSYPFALLNRPLQKTTNPEADIHLKHFNSNCLIIKIDGLFERLRII